MQKAITFKKRPGVLSFKRGHIISDALMYNSIPNKEDTPVQVIRHGLRGTQNTDPNGSKEVSNIQIIDTAKLDASTSAMMIRFNIAFLPLSEALFACAGKEKEQAEGIRQSIESFLERAKSSEGLREVARRYARNIINTRWLWRNRTLAEKIEVNVMIGDQILIKSLDSLQIPRNHFDNYTADEIKLADEIASQMRGDSLKSLTVKAIVHLRVPGAEVFPSQNYIEDKPKGFARSLYKIGHPENDQGIGLRVMGQAAIRDQKISNAIRTIDTWYPAFENEGFPIPVEPCGANLEMQFFYRPKKSSSLELIKQLNLIDPNEPDGMFCIACLNRGGVYSETEKDKNNDKKSAKTNTDTQEEDHIEEF